MSINSSTGLISGSLATAQTAQVTVFASDDTDSSSVQFTWTVTGTTTDPSILAGQTVTGSLAEGQWRYYRFDTSAGSGDLFASLSGLTSDLDLYTRVGSRPTLSSYSCRSYVSGTADETCQLSADVSGIVYVGVFGYRAGNYSLSLTDFASGEGESIAIGETVNSSVVQGQWIFYTLSNTGNFSGAQIALTNLNQDADLYVRRSGQPTLEVFDCRSYNGGSDNELCSIAFNGASGVTVGVFGYRASNYRLSVTGSGGTTTGGTTTGGTTTGGTTTGGTTTGGTTTGGTTTGGTTTGGTTTGGTTTGGTTTGGTTTGGTTTGGTTTGGDVNVTINPGQSKVATLGQGQWYFARVNNPDNRAFAMSTLTELSADSDLYVRVGDKPTLSNYDCRSYVSGTQDESCGLPLSNGVVYIGVYGYQAGSFKLTASAGTAVTAIDPATSRTRSISPGEWHYYRVLDTLNASSIDVNLTGMTTDNDLYVSNGTLPSLTFFDCRSFISGSANETCAANIDGSTFVGVYGYDGGRYTLSFDAITDGARKIVAKAKLAKNMALKSDGPLVSAGGGGAVNWLMLTLIGVIALVRRRKA